MIVLTSINFLGDTDTVNLFVTGTANFGVDFSVVVHGRAK
jgi:hypothetical protein